MKYAKELVEIVQREMGSAKEDYGSLRSFHEVYGVLLEEIQETDEESGSMVDALNAFWNDLRDKAPAERLEEHLLSIQDSALNTSEFALQVVAVVNLALEYLRKY